MVSRSIRTGAIFTQIEAFTFDKYGLLWSVVACVDIYLLGRHYEELLLLLSKLGTLFP